MITANRRHISKYGAANFRRIWFIGSLANYTQNIEKHFGCCGWNNVFDHCSGPAMSAIMYNQLNEGAIARLFHKIEDPSDHGEGTLPQNVANNSYDYDYNFGSQCDPLYDDCEDIGSAKPSIATNDEECAADGDEACVCKIMDNLINDHEIGSV